PRRPLGDLPPARARGPALRLGARPRSPDPVPARAADRGLPRDGACQSPARVLHPADRLPGRRGDGPRRTSGHARRDRGVAVGRLSRRRGTPPRHPRQAELGIPCREERFTRDEVYLADEAFFTGTAAEVTPIRELDDRRIGDGKPGPTTRRLQELFFAIVRGRDDRHRSWLAYV